MNRYNDVFHEEIIVRKNRGIANALYIAFTIFMYLFAIMAMISLQGVFQSLAGGGNLLTSIAMFLGFGVLAFGIFSYRDNLKTDYEYSYTNGILDIAKVKNNKTRKELLSCDIKEVELVAPIMTNGFDRYQSMSEIKKTNAWLNRDIKKYFAIIRKDNQRIMLIFEPSEKFVAVLKKYNPQKVKTQ